MYRCRQHNYIGYCTPSWTPTEVPTTQRGQPCTHVPSSQKFSVHLVQFFRTLALSISTITALIFHLTYDGSESSEPNFQYMMILHAQVHVWRALCHCTSACGQLLDVNETNFLLQVKYNGVQLALSSAPCPWATTHIKLFAGWCRKLGLNFT